MSTSPTFNTVTAKSINLANPGSMSAAGTVIAAEITATGNIWAANGNNRTATFSRVTASGNITGGNLLTLGTTQSQSVVSTVIRANNSLTVGGPISAGGNVTGNFILGNGSQLSNLGGPAFRSIATVSQSVPTSPTAINPLPLIYNSVSSNLDGGYNNTNGVFYAPRSGFYQINASCAVAPTNWALVPSYISVGTILLQSNSGTTSYIASGQLINFAGIVAPGAVIGTVLPASISTLVYLTAGQFVRCVLAYATTAPSGFWQTYNASTLIPNYFQGCWLRS